MAAPATAPETAEPEVFLRVNPTITRLATQLTSRNDRKGLIRKHPVISPISSLKRQIHAYRNDRTGSSQPEVFCSRRRAYADDNIWQVPRDQQILPDMVQDNMYTARVSLRFDAETPKGHEGRKKGVLETGRHAAKRLDQHLNNSCLPQTSTQARDNEPPTLASFRPQEIPLVSNRYSKMQRSGSVHSLCPALFEQHKDSDLGAESASTPDGEETARQPHDSVNDEGHGSGTCTAI